MATFRAGTMAGGEGGHFVEEEQLRVRVGAHHLAMAPAERGATGDPARDLPGTHDPPRVVVQDAAIAHQQAALLNRDDCAKRRDPILEWHTCFLLRRWGMPIHHAARFASPRRWRAQAM